MILTCLFFFLDNRLASFIKDFHVSESDFLFVAVLTTLPSGSLLFLRFGVIMLLTVEGVAAVTIKGVDAG